MPYECTLHKAVFRLPITCTLRKAWIQKYYGMPPRIQQSHYYLFEGMKRCRYCRGADEVLITKNSLFNM